MERESVVEKFMMVVLGFVAALFVLGLGALAMEMLTNPACVLAVCS
jgi:hypothetical protein